MTGVQTCALPICFPVTIGGVGDLSAGCKFTSTTYGIIIGIYRAIPQLDFSRVGIDRNLFKADATDFPVPEFDSIGMQTQYRCELSAPVLGCCTNIAPLGPASNIDMSVTYGYAPRYAELKSARDYFEGGFCGTYSTWVTGYDEYFLKGSPLIPYKIVCVSRIKIPLLYGKFLPISLYHHLFNLP